MRRTSYGKRDTTCVLIHQPWALGARALRRPCSVGTTCAKYPFFCKDLVVLAVGYLLQLLVAVSGAGGVLPLYAADEIDRCTRVVRDHLRPLPIVHLHLGVV